MNEPQPLINYYRPDSFAAVLGQDEAIAALHRTIKGNTHAHSYLLHGPSGVGKTTLARILAKEFAAEVLELDAAKFNGVDAMRELSTAGQHMALSGSGARMFILNECQRLSRAAWDSLLTILEEPPKHLYFALTTTEYDKVPTAVQTRCAQIKLNKVTHDVIATLLEDVIADQKFKVKDDVFNAIIIAADGSPRLALSILQSTHDADSVEEVKRVVTLVEESDPIIELCRFLLGGKRGWGPIQRMVSRIADDDFEQCAIQAGRYIAGAMLKSDDSKAAQKAWYLLDALTRPTDTYDRKVAFVTAVGRILWEGAENV